MPLMVHLVLLAAACVYAFRDPRRAWLLALPLGVLQDPIRKVTPGHSVVISFSIVALYAAILVASRRRLAAGATDISVRVPSLYAAGGVMIALLLAAALRGVITFGVSYWKAPALSLITYSLPLLLVLFGYVWARSEEDVFAFFRAYAVVTSVALVGTVIEYLRVDFPGIGTVALQVDWIRHLPGIQVRMLAGFYRGPDIMASHAAMLTAVSAAMAARSGVRSTTLLWGMAAGWGFLNCVISGRRKAIYFVIVFSAVFLWRYFRHLKMQEILAVAAIVLVLAGVVQHLAARQETSVYTAAAATSRAEVAGRLEGGLMSTFSQFGLLGAGLGAATQGVGHLIPREKQVGWQEGGLAKLAIEVGLPGLIAALMVLVLFLRIGLLLTRIPDVPGCSSFVRVTLFALFVANVAMFAASAQAYSDAVLASTAAFFAGAFLATAALDERTSEAKLLNRDVAPTAVPALR